jgi:hypothetical protein
MLSAPSVVSNRFGLIHRYDSYYGMVIATFQRVSHAIVGDEQSLRPKALAGWSGRLFSLAEHDFAHYDFVHGSSITSTEALQFCVLDHGMQRGFDPR